MNNLEIANNKVDLRLIKSRERAQRATNYCEGISNISQYNTVDERIKANMLAGFPTN
jgi:hypothetical protein